VGDELDDAFNYLVIVLSIIAGALFGVPELYVSPPYPSLEGGYGLAMLRVLILPVVILIFFWLWGLLARNKGSQVVVKSISWILAFTILIADLTLLSFSLMSPYFPTAEERPSGPGALLPALYLIFYAPAYLPIIFSNYVIRPRMKETYRDSRFLNNPWGQALLYIGAFVYYQFYYVIFCFQQG